MKMVIMYVKNIFLRGREGEQMRITHKVYGFESELVEAYSGLIMFDTDSGARDVDNAQNFDFLEPVGKTE
jgi:hypothetical protein